MSYFLLAVPYLVHASARFVLKTNGSANLSSSKSDSFGGVGTGLTGLSRPGPQKYHIESVSHILGKSPPLSLVY